jgi:hypothetical protein
MKKWLLILSLFIFPVISVFGQDEEPDEPEVGGKIQQRMQEYIESRLKLSKDEAVKFRPIFLRYFREFGKAHKEFKSNRDKLEFQRKIIDIRLRYRTEFRQAINEQKADDIFKHEDKFRVEARKIINENRTRRPIKTIRANKAF